MNRSRIVLETVAYMGLRGLLYGMIFGAVYGTIVFPLVGTISGTLFGAIVGLPLGLIGGALLGFIIALFFNPVEDIGVFRLVISLSGGLIALTGAFLGFVGLLGGDGTLPEQLGRLFSNENFVYYLTPALIAAACAVYVSNNYAKRYLEQQRTMSVWQPES